MAEFSFAFLDCEFGGLDPELHDITEIAVITTDYRLAEQAEKEWKVQARPERISPEAAKISGYDPEVWAAEAVPLRQALTEMAGLHLLASKDYAGAMKKFGAAKAAFKEPADKLRQDLHAARALATATMEPTRSQRSTPALRASRSARLLPFLSGGATR